MRWEKWGEEIEFGVVKVLYSVVMWGEFMWGVNNGKVFWDRLKDEGGVEWRVSGGKKGERCGGKLVEMMRMMC